MKKRVLAAILWLGPAAFANDAAVQAFGEHEDLRVAATPEPATIGMIAVGLAGLALVARRRRAK